MTTKSIGTILGTKTTKTISPTGEIHGSTGAWGVSGTPGTCSTTSISSPVSGSISASKPSYLPPLYDKEEETSGEFEHKFNIKEVEGKMKLEIRKMTVSPSMQRKIIKLSNKFIEDLLDIFHEHRGSLAGEKFGL